MTVEWWLGVMLGTGIGGGYGVARFLTTYYATQHANQRFLKLLFGGLIVRLGTGILLAGLTVAMIPVHRLAFTMALLLSLIGGLVLDVLFALQTGGASSSDR